jgi:F-type H+-transporting ATPase subunit b
LHAFVTALIVAQEHVEEEVNEPKDLYPHLNELIVGAIAFGVLFFFVWKWVLPRLNKVLEERRQKIQGSLEEAEKTRRDADQLLERYQQQLRDAGTEASRIIEEARKTAEQMRKDLLAKAEDESHQIVAKAQEEVRAERDRAVQSLRRELAEASVDLAGRVVGETLDKERHVRLVERFIDEVQGMSSGNGEGKGG